MCRWAGHRSSLSSPEADGSRRHTVARSSAARPRNRTVAGRSSTAGLRNAAINRSSSAGSDDPGGHPVRYPTSAPSASATKSDPGQCSM